MRSAMKIGYPCALMLLAVAGGIVFGQQQQPAQDGRMLERNTQVGGGSNTPRANMRDEVARRNALITGNAGGSRSFRGNVGYTAPGEFRGLLGSDETFAFRRDASSGSTLLGGGYLSRDSSGGLGTRRGGLVDTSLGFRNQPGLSGNGRQFTGTRVIDQGLGSTTVGVQAGKSGELNRVEASSLPGLKPVGIGALPPSGAPARSKDTVAEPQERPGLLQDLNAGLRQGLEPQTERSDGRSAGNLIENLNEPMATRTVYDELRERMRDQGDASEALPPTEAAPEAGPTLPGARTGTVDPWEERLAKLRARLRTEENSLPTGKEKKQLTRKESMLAGLREREAAEAAERAKREEIDKKTLEMIRQAGGEASQFVDPATGERDPFAQLMTRGQRALGEQRYFDAEELFESAVAMRPDDPTATSARLHAQIGAGLYRSAAATLRNVLANAPELTGMRYTGATIPAKERLVSIAAELRSLINEARDVGVDPDPSHALLLAYLGWQTADDATVREGLDILRTISAKAFAESGKRDPLLPVLEGVWLGDETGKAKE
jgi:hypothetical protein